jgi:hypothetical protein
VSDITLTLVPWAPGTSVGAYPRRSEQLRPDGPPTGITPTDTEVVADDASLSYNLADGEYWAAAPVNGSDHWQYVSFVAETPFDDEGHALAAAQSQNGHWHEVMVDDIGRLSTVDLGPSQPPHGPPPYATLGDLELSHEDIDARLDTVEGDVAEIQASRIRSITDDIGILTGADPTGVANAAAVIQAHLDTGDQVFMPEGTYKLGTTGLTLSHSNQTLFGANVLATVLVYDGTGAAIKNADPAVFLSYGALADFSIDSRAAGAGHCAIELESVFRMKLERLRLNGTGASGTGLRLKGSASTYCYLNEYESLFITAGLYCVDIGDNCNGNLFTGGILDGAGTAIRVLCPTVGSATNTWETVAIQTRHATMISLGAGASDNGIVQCRMEPVPAGNIAIAAGAYRNFITGNLSAVCTITDAAPTTNGTVLIVPSMQIFRIGSQDIANPKRTLDLLGLNAGITFGNDALCNWYRRAAGKLKSDASIESASTLQTYQGGATSVVINDSGVIQQGTGANGSLFLDSKGTGRVQLNVSGVSTGGTTIEAAAGKVGFFGAAAVPKRTLAAAATDPATTQALANSLRQALIDLGLGA